jgi:hypothetical protein
MQGSSYEVYDRSTGIGQCPGPAGGCSSQILTAAEQERVLRVPQVKLDWRPLRKCKGKEKNQGDDK